MFACVDVGYNDTTARAACVAFERWEDACASEEYALDMSDVQPYVPGRFYQCELPCVLAVLEQLPTLARMHGENRIPTLLKRGD